MLLSEPITEYEYQKKQAHLCIERGDWLESYLLYQKIIEYRPEEWDNYIAMGDIQINLEKWSEAAATYERSIQLNSNFDWAWHNLAVAFGKLGKWDDVEKCQSALAALKPDFWKINGEIELVRKHKEAFEMHQQAEVLVTPQPAGIGFHNLLVNRPQSEREQRETEIPQSKFASDFDFHFYTDYYKDLKQLNEKKAFEHWQNSGYKEGRIASFKQLASKLGALESDLPKEFDTDKYSALNPDLKSSGIATKWKLIEHWLVYGRKEKRKYELKIGSLNEGEMQSLWMGVQTSENIFLKISQAAIGSVGENIHYPMPSLSLIKHSGSPDITHFKQNSLFYMRDIIEQCMLKRDASVLDIGCGAGRLALSLLRYLNKEGQYYGLDVNPAMVEWCTRQISYRNSNFVFSNPGIQNNYYYKTDNKLSNEYSLLSLTARQFDCAAAISIFNHIKAADMLQYLHLIADTLAPDGVAYATFWIIDDEFFAFRQQTGKHRGLEEHEQGVWYGYQKQSFFAGYSLSYLEQQLAKRHLCIVGSSPGNWAQKRNARLHQDWLLIGRA